MSELKSEAGKERAGGKGTGAGNSAGTECAGQAPEKGCGHMGDGPQSRRCSSGGAGLCGREPRPLLPPPISRVGGHHAALLIGSTSKGRERPWVGGFLGGRAGLQKPQALGSSEREEREGAFPLPPGLCDPPSRIHGACAGTRTQSSQALQTADSRTHHACC